MKKYILVLLIFGFAGYSQTKIHIGETTRNISNYYHDQGYDVSHYTTETENGELSKLKLNTKDVVVIYEYDVRTSICYSQTLLFKNKKAYYNACDDLKIRYEYDTYYPVIEQKKYEIKATQVKVSDGKLADKIIIYSR